VRLVVVVEGESLKNVAGGKMDGKQWRMRREDVAAGEDAG
jgi:hypothetical protein